LQFVWLPLPLFPVGRRCFFDRNVRPDSRVLRIQRQPFLKPWFGVRLDRVDWAFRFAHTAIDAFIRVDHKHVLALVEAIHGTHVDAVHGFAANAALVDDVGQLNALSADRSSVLIHDVFAVQAAQAELQKQHPKRGTCPGDPLQAPVQGGRVPRPLSSDCPVQMSFGSAG
jgi:hypothetical protein